MPKQNITSGEGSSRRTSQGERSQGEITAAAMQIRDPGRRLDPEIVDFAAIQRNLAVSSEYHWY